jgi:multidrug efflux pump
MTGTGILALAGIVVNNAIVLMDTFNRFRHDGLETIEAALKAAAQRVRPILLTTITTIAGLIPMALQINLNFFDRVIQVGSITSIWWVQLATAVISGLAFSTVLTLVIVPVMLCLPTVWASSFAAWDRWLIGNAAPYRAVARAYGRDVQAPAPSPPTSHTNRIAMARPTMIVGPIWSRCLRPRSSKSQATERKKGRPSGGPFCIALWC